MLIYELYGVDCCDNETWTIQFFLKEEVAEHFADLLNDAELDGFSYFVRVHSVHKA